VALGKDQGITHALQVAQWQHRRSGSGQERLAKQLDAFPKTSTYITENTNDKTLF